MVGVSAVFEYQGSEEGGKAGAGGGGGGRGNCHTRKLSYCQTAGEVSEIIARKPVPDGEFEDALVVLVK